jgi:hypothetical protein
MKLSISRYKLNFISILCAFLLFLAVLNLPLVYYSFLRMIIFFGALLMIICKQNQFYWGVAFLSIAILFNPLIPIYLYIKDYWLPIDIITGFVFLLHFNSKSKKKVSKQSTSEIKTKPLFRDKLY